MTKSDIEKLADEYCTKKFGSITGNKPVRDAFIEGFELNAVSEREKLRAFAEYLDDIHGGEVFAVNEIDNFIQALNS